jgi:hypothetical protein
MAFEAPGIIPTKSFILPIFSLAEFEKENHQNQIRFGNFLLNFSSFFFIKLLLVLFLLKTQHLPFQDTFCHTMG